jgi:hypothetical protein
VLPISQYAESKKADLRRSEILGSKAQFVKKGCNKKGHFLKKVSTFSVIRCIKNIDTHS